MDVYKHTVKENLLKILTISQRRDRQEEGLYNSEKWAALAEQVCKQLS